MSLKPMTKKCPKCKKTYPFNPDVGLGLRCPHCAGLGIPLGNESKNAVPRNQRKS